MNFSSPHGLVRLGKVPSLIQETKVLARAPSGLFFAWHSGRRLSVIQLRQGSRHR